MNGRFEIVLYVDALKKLILHIKTQLKNGATSVLEPKLEPRRQRTCYITDQEQFDGDWLASILLTA